MSYPPSGSFPAGGAFPSGGYPGVAPIASPASIANLQFWLTNPATLGFANGATVTSWTDIQGGQNAVAAAGFSAGTFVANAYGARGAVRFNGTDQLMKAGSYAPTNPPFTFGIVFRMSSTITWGTPNHGVFVTDKSGQGGYTLEMDQHQEIQFGYRADPFLQTVQYGMKNAGEIVFALGTYSDNGDGTCTATFYVNGVLADQRTFTFNTGTSDGTFLGGYNNASFLCGCDIMEVFTYTRVLTSAENAQLTQLMNKWWGTRIAGRGSYVLTHFTMRSTNPASRYEALHLSESNDGNTWWPLGAKITGMPADRTCSDPCMLYYGGYWWVAFTLLAFQPAEANASFGIAKALPGTGNFQYVATVSCAAIAGTRTCWSPKWNRIGGTPSLIINLSPNISVGPFLIYEMHPTNAGMTSWSSPVQVTGTNMPASIIDAYVFKKPYDLSKYWMLLKDENAAEPQFWQSDSPFSGYTFVEDAGWTPLVSNEGYSLIWTGGESSIITSDYYSGSGVPSLYMSTLSTNDDFDTFTGPTTFVSPYVNAAPAYPDKLGVRNGFAQSRGALQ